TPTVSRHLHVPLQSGDDGVLRDMARRYTAAGYLARVAPLRDDFNLTTDAIVGLPTETEAAFLETVAVVAEAGITKVHGFPCARRVGRRDSRCLRTASSAGSTVKASTSRPPMGSSPSATSTRRRTRICL